MGKSLDELIALTLQRLGNDGLGTSAMVTYKRAYRCLNNFCEINNVLLYSTDVGENFLKDLQNQTSIKPKNCSHYRTAIKHLNCTFTGAEILRGPYGRAPTPYVDTRFNEIRDSYEKHLIESGKTAKDIRSRMLCVSRFLKFAEQRNVNKLSDLSSHDIYAAFQEASCKRRFRCLTGHFLTYLYRRGITDQNLYFFIPSPVRHKAIPSVYSSEEVERILRSIDRTTVTGKRNYAIVLVAARLGIRASDIAGLTFDSIVRSESESKINVKQQQKTKNPLILPLLPQVQDAIDDYLNTARQKSADPHIFLNVTNNEPVSPANISKIVEMTITAAGIETKNRRKGAHSLRASLATALIEEGNSYATVQQVLGHSNIQATKAYVKVSIDHLRAYSLAVPPPSGGFKALLEKEGTL